MKIPKQIPRRKLHEVVAEVSEQIASGTKVVINSALVLHWLLSLSLNLLWGAVNAQ